MPAAWFFWSARDACDLDQSKACATNQGIAAEGPGSHDERRGQGSSAGGRPDLMRAHGELEIIPAQATGVLLVDLAQIRENWRALAELASPAECSAVVKADAYGLGVGAVTRALAAEGCTTFFVATPAEALEVLDQAPRSICYVLDGPMPGAARSAWESGARPVLSTLEAVRWWLASPFAAKPAALHVDTGLHRLALTADEVAELAADDDLLSRLNIALVMSHLACADEPGHEMNEAQRAMFETLRARLPAAPASLAASDGMMLGSDFRLDLVRPGYALYGGQAVPANKSPVRPVVTARARILKVQDVPRGHSVGYSATWTATAPRRIATIAAGYADGVFRHASAASGETGGTVLIKGQTCRLVGRVSMDLVTVDVTECDGVRAGDWAELIGPSLSLEEVGRSAGTIGYEVLTRLGRRFHRIYLPSEAHDG